MLVRPSYVLGGRAMVIAYDADAVAQYMRQAVEYSQERPVLVDHFLENAVEVDVDALCDSEDVLIAGIMQHIEEAGIHSGDSSCVLPAVGIREETLETLRAYTRKLALALKVVGLVNLQFAIQRDAQGNDHVYVIEVNPRASRTVPYVSKATGVPLAKIAARLMTGRKLRELLPEQLASGKDLETGHALLREVAGVSVVEVCRRGYGAGAGDEVDGRSDGRGERALARPLPRRSSRRGRCCPPAARSSLP